MSGRGEAERTHHPSPGFPDEFAPDPLEAAFFDRLSHPAVDEVRLPATAESAGEARRLTLSVLELWGLVQQREAAEQLVGELVANAVRHTGGRTVGVRFARRPGCLRVEVRDPSRALPCLIRVEADADSGRGLQLVEAMSDRWGADLLSRGKSVWFELRVRER
ncbi:ATP-binding protein [Streptacidiphilus sp. ASG 303]|uniref:ATP-binding protein n=1 Tax=Streptomycetaceae TaxID=2062 RepID=UPI001E5217CE|nr:ATP-binding protein [Streptacidiphilus sp. ASG 303]MCD0483020.1 ATP-binding protein [Streptacidiphilus sp. ASG 303]